MGDVLKYRIPGRTFQEKIGKFFELNSSEGYSGFFLSNFDQTMKYGFLESATSSECHDISELPTVIPKSMYLFLAEAFIDEMKKGTFEKLVLSRIHQIKLPFSADQLFTRLIHQYPDAFVYLISSPLFGTWIGASPEVLLKETNNVFEIASLAGTKLNKDESPWGEKEKKEQQIVTDFIDKTLRKLNVTEFQQGEAETSVAGPVKHLKTTFAIHDKIDVVKLISGLHPTPAVSGIPRDAAVKLIQQMEPHDRGLYAGIIGEIGAKTSLFVNLRCMQCIQESAYLYLGGGLTVDSIPELEWIETENKAKTLLNVLSSAED